MASSNAPVSKKFYVTAEGAEKLKQDYKNLLELRKQLTEEGAPSILHSEDINPEYLMFQEDMGILEEKLTEYEQIFEGLEMITSPEKGEQDRAWLGAIVTVKLDSEIDEFMLVGTLEADPSKKKISNESPIGKALLGARVGDVVDPRNPMLRYKCEVLKISYPPKP